MGAESKTHAAAAKKIERYIFTPPSSTELRLGARTVQRTVGAGIISLRSADSPAHERRAMNGFNDLAQMLRDELGHLEHAHLALTVEYRPE